MAPRLWGSFDGPVGPTDGQDSSRSDKEGERVGDQAITSPGRCALNLSLRAQTDPNDPNLWHEANQFGRPGPHLRCSEAGLAFRGPFRPRCGLAASASAGIVVWLDQRVNFL